MMKIKQIKLGSFVWTGSKVLKAIMDNYTPPVDLFVREVVQNCADACLETKEFIRINFIINKFRTKELCDFVFEKKEKYIKDNLLKDKKLLEYDFIAISDKNTTGLLGEAYKTNGPNNLYNLVYDILTGKDNKHSGGSYGIGKTVYYRYGNGMCFYYSRTFENNKYVSKLVGTLIQDENKDTCILGKNTSGIAFFADLNKSGDSCPINNEKEISNFLKIFKIEPYKDEETGTVVIIPFVNIEDFLNSNNDAEDSPSRFWLGNINSCLKMAIQRWYFPRINNPKYNGKYIVVAINNNKIVLDKFYDTLQKLYNNEIEDANNLPIPLRKKSQETILGYFRYKVFDNLELNINIKPDNYPSPRYIVDSNYDSDKQGLLFYTRKPGMIINYNNTDFGTYDVPDDKYLIGIFVLEDSCEFEGENVGNFFKGMEAGNHAKWEKGSKVEGYSALSKIKPYNKICSFIKNELDKEFKNKTIVEIESNTTQLQSHFGQKLLPPLDFGTKPSSRTKSPADGDIGRLSKKNKVSIINTFDDEGNLKYIINFILQPNYMMKITTNINVGNKTISLDEWEEMSFTSPIEIKEMKIIDCFIGKNKQSYGIENNIIDQSFDKNRIKRLLGSELYRIKGYKTKKEKPYKLTITNLFTEIENFTLELLITPLDNKYVVSVDALINKGEDN